MQTQEADGWRLTLFINPESGRQENGHVQVKGQNQFRVQKIPKGRQNQGQASQDDQAGKKEVQSQAGVKTGGLSKRE